jgi:hypothetical protein
MNKGIVVGQILSDGEGAGDAIVCLTRVVGSSGEIPITDGKGNRLIYGDVDRGGRFRIRFQWSGTEIGEVMVAPMMFLVAWTETRTKSRGVEMSQVTAKARTQTRGFLLKNVGEMQESVVSTFKAKDDARDFAEELAKLSIALLSTESWILAGGTYVFLE